MPAKVGPLLNRALAILEDETPSEKTRLLAASHLGFDSEDERLPLVVKLDVERPQRGEIWQEYKHRIDTVLSRFSEQMHAAMGAATEPLYLGNAARSAVRPDQVGPLAENEAVRSIELDTLVQVTCMDNASVDVGLDEFRANHIDSGGDALDGRGVNVAVLDSGVDTWHPHLHVFDSVSTSGEAIEVPGAHGTHVAGSIASNDSVFRGIAPKVNLINVKVLRQDGRGTVTNITKGVDEAADRNANVLSMSLGFNHLPYWSDGGHGWSCPDGLCPLCTAVNNAVDLGIVVVVAAGNEHLRAENLRNFGYGNSFDTELGCPGQAERTVTVAALTKTTFLPASFSSRGPASYADIKPDTAAPGVNITSTVPVPRAADGSAIPNPNRSQLFARMSGTSMATPIVAGATALLIQHHVEQGTAWDPASIRQALLSQMVTNIGQPPHVTGAGRLDLAVF